MQGQSLGILSLILLGILYRRRRTLHVRIMSLAIIWDVILILQIELSRSAIVKASGALGNPMALNIHVSIAVSTVILYALMVFTGRKMLAGQVQFRNKHRILGYSTVVMRILTFVTSFWAVAPKG